MQDLDLKDIGIHEIRRVLGKFRLDLQLVSLKVADLVLLN